MPLRQHRHRIGADLVGDVAVRGNAISADHHEIDLTPAHQESRRIIGDQRHRDTVLREFPCGQPRALQERTGLVGKHADLLARLDRRANHAQRRAVAGGGERARIAVREHARPVLEQHGAMLSHPPVGFDVGGADRVRLGKQHERDLGRRAAAESLQGVAHARERPEEIDCSRAARRQCGKPELKPGIECGDSRLLQSQRFERDAVGRGATDGRRAAHYHAADAFSNPGRGIVRQIAHLGRQHTLIDHLQAAVRPAQGFHGHRLFAG